MVTQPRAQCCMVIPSDKFYAVISFLFQAVLLQNINKTLRNITEMLTAMMKYLPFG